MVYPWGMASKRKQRRKACTGKVRHETLEFALIAKKMVPYGKELVAYKCKSCGGFHIGHPPKKVRRAIANRQKGL